MGVPVSHVVCLFRSVPLWGPPQAELGVFMHPSQFSLLEPAVISTLPRKPLF